MLTAPEIALTSRAAFLLEAGEPEGAAWTYHRAAVSALLRGKPAVAQELLDRCADIVLALDAPGLTIGIELVRAHIERAAGARESSARVLDEAARRAVEANDEAGLLLVWLARSGVMLQDPSLWTDGWATAAWLRPRLQVRGLRAAWLWLTLLLAHSHLQAGHADRAASFAAQAIEVTAPGSPDHIAAVAVAARAMLVGGQLAEAVDIAGGALREPAHGTPAALRAELFMICAGALLAIGDQAAAAECAEHARALVPPPVIGAVARFIGEPRWLVD